MIHTSEEDGVASTSNHKIVKKLHADILEGELAIISQQHKERDQTYNKEEEEEEEYLLYNNGTEQEDKKNKDTKQEKVAILEAESIRKSQIHLEMDQDYIKEGEEGEYHTPDESNVFEEEPTVITTADSLKNGDMQNNDPIPSNHSNGSKVEEKANPLYSLLSDASTYNSEIVSNDTVLNPSNDKPINVSTTTVFNDRMPPSNLITVGYVSTTTVFRDTIPTAGLPPTIESNSSDNGKPITHPISIVSANYHHDEYYDIDQESQETTLNNGTSDQCDENSQSIYQDTSVQYFDNNIIVQEYEHLSQKLQRLFELLVQIPRLLQLLLLVLLPPPLKILIQIVWESLPKGVSVVIKVINSVVTQLCTSEPINLNAKEIQKDSNIPYVIEPDSIAADGTPPEVKTIESNPSLSSSSSILSQKKKKRKRLNKNKNKKKNIIKVLPSVIDASHIQPTHNNIVQNNNSFEQILEHYNQQLPAPAPLPILEQIDGLPILVHIHFLSQCLINHGGLWDEIQILNVIQGMNAIRYHLNPEEYDIPFCIELNKCRMGICEDIIRICEVDIPLSLKQLYDDHGISINFYPSFRKGCSNSKIITVEMDFAFCTLEKLLQPYRGLTILQPLFLQEFSIRGKFEDVKLIFSIIEKYPSSWQPGFSSFTSLLNIIN